MTYGDYEKHESPNRRLQDQKNAICTQKTLF